MMGSTILDGKITKVHSKEVKDEQNSYEVGNKAYKRLA